MTKRIKGKVAFAIIFTALSFIVVGGCSFTAPGIGLTLNPFIFFAILLWLDVFIWWIKHRETTNLTQDNYNEPDKQ